MRKHLHTVLEYFAYFSYAPSFQELYLFFPKKIGRKNLQSILDKEIKQKKILRLLNLNRFRLSRQSLYRINYEYESPRYTLPQYSIFGQNKSKSQIQIKGKILTTTIQAYIFFLKICPTILFVAITGRSAMKGLQKNDDLDLFFITSKNTLWTTRFFSVLLAKILGIHTTTGVCLNLLFDESDIRIPQHKQNSYIAHEILQMKPIIDKANIYQKFLTKNRWIYKYFPNAKSQNQNQIETIRTSQSVYKNIDRIFKSIQLPIIIRNNTALSISHTQLWLFKKDFEKKLKRRGLVI